MGRRRARRLAVARLEEVLRPANARWRGHERAKARLLGHLRHLRRGEAAETRALRGRGRADVQQAILLEPVFAPVVEETGESHHTEAAEHAHDDANAGAHAHRRAAREGLLAEGGLAKVGQRSAKAHVAVLRKRPDEYGGAGAG